MITWLVDALAVYRLTRLITVDGFPPIRRAREWVLRRWPSEDTELAESEMVEATSITAAEWVEIERPAETAAWNWERRWVALSPHWLGELVTCAWCVSVYAAGLVVAARALVSVWGYVSLALAFSAVAGWLSRFDES